MIHDPPHASHEPAVLERITTGVAHLDLILHGGIPRYALVFVAGPPGTGKTVLSQHAAFANARAGSTCLYLTTFAEPTIKILRYLQGFSFFDLELLGQRVIYGDLGQAARAGDPEALLRAIDALMRAHQPQLVVIDSFKALHDCIPDAFAFRTFTLDLAVHLAAWEVTSLLVGEYADEELRSAPEFATADGIIYLYGTEEAARQKRYLRIMKMRGTPYFAGEHFFTIDAAGLTVFARISPRWVMRMRSLTRAPPGPWTG